ncbi:MULTISPECIES: ABC transporter ATP-binding protein [Caballeronia]|jgi:branched-chain amino acid transport system ATP-binding protein|uniref:Mannosyltransferase n=2 Tax=Burkholderiaceae TaxID=119060 RepID=A0A656QJ79_9BURK|nr:MULTISPECIES: ABC transporter ATP-binding protein [Caballeronia]KDR28089.1 mannosyltransferase [Caballeronia zhejiangensis]MDR5765632.1 ABC transporter ATP-binding protein [Caballeronia sp. LZ028]
MKAQLRIDDLRAWYGAAQVLHGVHLCIDEGEAVALVGRNGSGRSTLAKAIMGLVRCAGDMRYRDVQLVGLRAHRIARLGIGYVPETRDVFPALTVRENLVLGERKGTRFALRDAYRLFPVLEERASVKAGALSGGEQQMLALARTLTGDPSLVVIDEPGEGLAPQVLAQVAACLAMLRNRGVATLLIEERLTIARTLDARVAVMGHGAIQFDGTIETLARDEAISRQWLSVGGTFDSSQYA